ncbi:MAG: hypothetical protein CL578_03930 [Alteromonadaceae bacterium]|uniref:O-antigen ligase family protein n=1 Tax=Paraglaciecola chathamensis TaxID=368405 RepID=UPI000C6B16F2|nr:O-antigen ligase family protein [Paraglaciecola agarilytica]MBN24185.1 hypothetical protein [Alteromonadaceae bacterium]|tara:strand:- start:17755 stop:19038 length:1284 start_codon:yes stop_codon:yes gene_type:complete
MFEIVKVVMAIICAVFVFKTCKSVKNKYLIFVVFALTLRYMLSAFHNITYDPLFAGFSINALGSIFVVFLGFLILPNLSFRLRHYLVFYAFFSVIVVSGVVNGELKGLINVLVKWGYFFTISAALFLSLRLQPVKVVFKVLLVPFLLPVSLQILSILFGEVKATENDGSVSYIGGYNHEAAFSMIIVGFILVLGWLERKTIKFHSPIFFVAVFLLFLVNYRTAILAILPVLMIFILTLLSERVESKYKLPILAFSALIIGIIGLVLSSSLAERFSDITVVFTNFSSLFKESVYYSELDKDIFSGRVYLWSQYLGAFFHADTLHQFIGFGPESWSDVFDKYAHNAYVSYLYEFGFIGIATFLAVNFYLLVQALKNRSKILGQKLFFSVIGLMIMSLSTMPLWNIEGLICYALITGAIFAKGHSPIARE